MDKWTNGDGHTGQNVVHHGIGVLTRLTIATLVTGGTEGDLEELKKLEKL